MTLQTFRELLDVRPFQPFRLTLSSGESYDVRRRELAFLTQKEIVVGTGEADDGVPDDFKICSPSHVMAVELMRVGRDPAGS